MLANIVPGTVSRLQEVVDGLEPDRVVEELLREAIDEAERVPPPATHISPIVWGLTDKQVIR